MKLDFEQGSFNKVVKQLYFNHPLAWVFSCKFAAYFQNTFLKEHIWRAASEYRSIRAFLSSPQA